MKSKSDGFHRRVLGVALQNEKERVALWRHALVHRSAFPAIRQVEWLGSLGNGRAYLEVGIVGEIGRVGQGERDNAGDD